ncbi:MAG: cytochrome [Nocardia sp.]|uniref:cytochrome P450 n=1 Tax=Nocardia sp. TaxID=1821 RepID=UPI0026112760|nr:cytochrome P450 [Nocardia sp.]MCU1644939.1 cytochrome [Nocardia sp.]
MAQVNQDDRSAADVFDPFTQDFLRDPYPHYHKLRAHSPIFFHPQLNAWLISGYRELDDLLRSNNLGRGDEMRFFGNFTEGGGVDRVSVDWIFYKDPPDHTRLRRIFAQAFTPRRVESLRAYTRDVVDSLLDDLEHDNNFIRAVADRLPVKVICRMLGVPENLHDAAKVRSSALVPLLDPLISDAQLEAAEAASSWFLELFGQIVEEKARQPGHDLISALLEAEADGERLTRAEIIGNVVFLFAAGHETTTSTIGSTLVALLRNPDELQLLLQQPELAAGAIAESVRWDSPVQYVGRLVTKEFTYEGVEFVAGQRVMGMIGAANRDPRQFPNPDQYAITRDEGKSMAFGSGIHFCMGAALARMEAEIALDRIFTRYPRISLLSEPVQGDRFAMRSYSMLEVKTR